MVKRIAKIILYDKKSKKVLLQLRDNISTIAYPNTWTLFGGEIAKNETPEEALRRELKEEINGLEITSLKKLFTKIRNQGNLKVEDNIFCAEINSDISSMKILEGQKMKLFSETELEFGNIFLPFKQYIKRFLKE